MRTTITLVNRPGHRVGDHIFIQSTRGDMRYKVVEVKGTTITLRRARDWYTFWFVVLVLALALGGAAIAFAKARNPRLFVGPPAYTWDYIGEGRRPATLRDCDERFNISVSYSSQAGVWQRFCGRGA